MTQHSAKYSAPLDITSQFYFCGVPFRLDSYQGCTHRCHYCFANKAFGGLRSSGVVERETTILPADLASIRRDFVAVEKGQPGKSLRRQFLAHRVPIHWGGMSDPFQPAEMRYRVSLQLLTLFARNQYPVVCSTKGVILGKPDYLARAKECNLAVQISLITLDERLRKRLEPYSPSVNKRLQLIELLASNGIWVAVRLQPMIIDTAIERDAPKLIRRVAECGAQHLIVEGYKPSVTNKAALRAVGEATGLDIIQQYREYGAIKYRHELELPAWRKYQYLVPLRDACHAVGITYGAADNQLHEESDTITCCGIDNLPGFRNFWRYQSTFAAIIARQKGEVSLHDLEDQWRPPGIYAANENWWRDHGNDKSLTGYFKWKWREGGPDSPEDLAHLRQITRAGQVIYEWVNHPHSLRPALKQLTL